MEAYYKSLAPVIPFSVGLDEGSKTADAYLPASTNLPYSCIVGGGSVLWGGSPYEGLEQALTALEAGTFDPKKAAPDAGRFSSFMQNLQRLLEGDAPEPMLKAMEEGIKGFPQYESSLQPLRFEILLQRKQDRQAAYALAKELATGLLRDNAGGLQRLAQALLEEGDEEALEIALQLAQRANELYQKGDAQSLALQAAICFAKGDTAGAVALQTQAMQQAQSKRERLTLKKKLKYYSTPAAGEPEEDAEEGE